MRSGGFFLQLCDKVQERFRTVLCATVPGAGHAIGICSASAVQNTTSTPAHGFFLLLCAVGGFPLFGLLHGSSGQALDAGFLESLEGVRVRDDNIVIVTL